MGCVLLHWCTFRKSQPLYYINAVNPTHLALEPLWFSFDLIVTVQIYFDQAFSSVFLFCRLFFELSESLFFFFLFLSRVCSCWARSALQCFHSLWEFHRSSARTQRLCVLVCVCLLPVHLNPLHHCRPGQQCMMKSMDCPDMWLLASTGDRQGAGMSVLMHDVAKSHCGCERKWCANEARRCFSQSLMFSSIKGGMKGRVWCSWCSCVVFSALH